MFHLSCNSLINVASSPKPADTARLFVDEDMRPAALSVGEFVRRCLKEAFFSPRVGLQFLLCHEKSYSPFIIVDFGDCLGVEA